MTENGESLERDPRLPFEAVFDSLRIEKFKSLFKPHKANIAFGEGDYDVSQTCLTGHGSLSLRLVQAKRRVEERGVVGVLQEMASVFLGFCLEGEERRERAWA